MVPIPKDAEFLRTLIRVPWAGETRWRDQRDERLYTWDALHGELEVFNSRGRHLGAVDPHTGKLIKNPVKGRKIDV